MANGTGSNQTAETAYTARLASTVANLRTLADLLRNHSERQAVRPTDWGFAGDLAHVDDKVGELVEFLKTAAGGS